MKKTPQQLELILAEAERVNSVLVNDYTSLKERVRLLTGEVDSTQQTIKTLASELREREAADLAQKEDLDRLNLIVEYEREQRFDWESKHEMLILQTNKTKIELINVEEKVKQQQATIRQQLESLQGKDELIEQHARKISTLDESLKGLKTNFDEMYQQHHDSKGQLESVENEKEQYLQKLSVSKQELAQARETISELETRISEEVKLMEMEQTHRCNLETQMDELQKHNRRLVQQVADVTAKDKASEKVVEELKMQIEQLERVRDHLTSLLDKDKSTKSPLEAQGAEDEKRLKSSQEHQPTHHFKAELDEKIKSIASLEAQVAALEKRYSQLESENAAAVSETNVVIQKLTEEVSSLKAEPDAQPDLAKYQEKERALNAKIKTMEDAIEDEREKLRTAEDTILELRKRYRDDMEQLQNSITPKENGNGTEEHDKAPDTTVEHKLKQNFEEEKLELEKMTQALHENRTRYKEELEKLKLERASLGDELQRVEDLKRDLEEREAQVALRKEELQELEKQIKDMDLHKHQIETADQKLKEEVLQFDAIKIQVEADKKHVEELNQQIQTGKSELEKEKSKHDLEAKTLATEKEHIEEEKKTLAEEKAAIDSELQRLVEQRLEMQQLKQEFEDKESQFLINIKDKDTKLEELSRSLAEERKQKEKLESKFSAGQKSPDSKDGLTFSYFKSRKKDKESENAVTQPDNLTDEERKMKVFNEYQVLLTEINTTLFQKREQVNDIETNANVGYLKKLGLGGLKSSITKLEDLQGRVKKGFRAIDDKTPFDASHEAAELAILKAFRNELT